MTRLLVSMGLPRGGRVGEPLRPVLRELDPDQGAPTRELWPELDPDALPGPESHQELTCAAPAPDGTIWQPAHTELFRIDPVALRIVDRFSHPRFHGLHSASPAPDGGVVLTAAGLDSVIELEADGAFLRQTWLCPGDFDAVHRGIDDFRKVDHDGFKPHRYHPNHAAWVGADLWVTCFETQEARSLTSDRRIPFPEAIPHDGRLREGLLWFTLITGRVVAVRPDTLERVLELDLRALSGTRALLGWCRGIEVRGSRLFVGMSALRRTRHREVLRQLLLGEAGVKLPTRVIEVDLDRRRIVRETEVGNPAGGTIYGLNLVG